MPEESEKVENNPEESSPNEERKSLKFKDVTQKVDNSKISLSKPLFFGLLVIAVIAILGSYFLGYNLGKSGSSDNTALEKKAEEKKNDPDIITAAINEEVTVKSGLTLKLEKAEFDSTFEKQKEENRKAIEKNSSQSAWLESDYYKQSLLNITVSIENKTEKEVSYSPSVFRLKDSSSVQYVGNFEGEKTQVYSINPSEKTRLNLSYPVPSDEDKFELVYENAVIEFSVK